MTRVVTTKPKVASAKAKPRATAVVRRSQAERSATTRAKVIEAAIACLHRLGYRMTTTTVVADEAGVSRGAMAHHFASKNELMLAVVRGVFETDSEHTLKSLSALEPLEVVRALPSTLWDVVSRPSGIAVMEIMLASRSDPDMAARLRKVQLQIDREARAWVIEQHAAAGIQERADGEAIHRLVVAAHRGLVLEAIFMRNRAEVEKSIAVLDDVMQYLYPKLAKTDKPARAVKATAKPPRSGAG